MGVQVNAQTKSDSEYVRAVHGWAYDLLDNNIHSPSAKCQTANDQEREQKDAALVACDAVTLSLEMPEHEYEDTSSRSIETARSTTWLHRCQNTKSYEWS